MRVMVAALLMVLVPGCLPVSTYYAEGVSAAQFQRDETGCDVQALSDAPVANQTRQAPPRYVPARQICDPSGTCRTQGAYWVPGEIYTVDVNATLRARVKGLCMADRGYRPVELPACPRGVAQAAPPGPSPVLPRLDPRSCAIRTEGGLRVVTQG